MWMMRTRDRGVVGVAALTVLLLAVAGAALADDEPVTETPPDEATEAAPFRDGPWFGTISANGGARTEVEGVVADLSTHHSGSVEFDVSGGQVSGQGDMPGTSIMRFSGELDAVIFMSHDTPGSLTGSSSGLTFDGTHTTVGTMAITGPVATSQQIGPNQEAFGPFDIEVVGFDCNRVFGDWSAGIQQAALDGGWQTTDIEGQFTADHMILDTGEDLRDRAEDLLERFNEWVDAVHDNVHADAEEPTSVFDDALRRQLTELFNEAVDLEFDLRNADPEERCALGPDEGGFSFLFTAMVQELAIYILNGHAGLDGETLSVLAENLAWMGGLGEGAIRTEAADRIETLMEERGSELLEEHLVTDDSQENQQGEPCSAATPCLDPNDDALEVLDTGARHDLTFSPEGIDITPEQAGDLLAGA